MNEEDRERAIRSVENVALTKLDLMLTDREPTYEELRERYERFNTVEVTDEVPFSHA